MYLILSDHGRLNSIELDLSILLGTSGFNVKLLTINLTAISFLFQFPKKDSDV